MTAGPTLALIGYGNVGRALARLLARTAPPVSVHHHRHPHTAARHGGGSRRTAGAEPAFGPRAASIEAFLDAARARIAVELTTLEPSTGEPAIAHIRAAFARGMHVVTANKGPHRARLCRPCATRPRGLEWDSASNRR